MNPQTRHRILAILGCWQFWIVVLVLVVGYVFLALRTRDQREARNEAQLSREQAVRIAERRAGADAAVQRCLDSIPSLAKVDRFVRGVQEFHRAVYRNALETHEATPPGSPVYRTQIRNLARLRDATAAVAGLEVRTPTRAECAAGAARAAHQG